MTLLVRHGPEMMIALAIAANALLAARSRRRGMSWSSVAILLPGISLLLLVVLI